MKNENVVSKTEENVIETAVDHNARIDAMGKKELVAMAIATGMTKSAANKMKKAELAGMFHVEHKRKMKEQMDSYRAGYVDTVSASGNRSLHNGDDVASTLAGMEPRDVVILAEMVLGMEAGELWNKYQNLNNGQQRMNSGNRIRNAIKRGDITSDDVVKAAH